MSHPYKDKAKDSNKSKLKNLDLPVMSSAGENKPGGIRVSSTSGQHQDQAKASGMKRGGRAYPLNDHGAGSGLGRKDKAHNY